MAYQVNNDALNVWAKDNDNTMDLSISTDASSVYLWNNRDLEFELGEGSMVSNIHIQEQPNAKFIEGTLNSSFVSATLKGRTLVNLVNVKDSTIADTYVQFNSLTKEQTEDKLTICNLANKTIVVQMDNEDGTWKQQFLIPTNEKLLINQKVDGLYGRVRGRQAEGWGIQESDLAELKKSVVVLEGDYTNTTFSYFEGVVSVVNPTIKTTEQSPTGKSSDLSLSNIQLRSRPNGACDEVNLETGEHIQRVEEVAVTSATLYANHQTDTHLTFSQYIQKTPKTDSSLYCNRFAHGSPYTDDPIECIGVDSSRVAFRIAKSKVTGSITSYLQQNPIIVQYELETPIVTKIDFTGHLYTYENGNIILGSDSAITPALEYSAITNKSGQISAIGKELQKQQKHLSLIEKMLVSNIVQMDYQNSLMELNLK